MYASLEKLNRKPHAFRSMIGLNIQEFDQVLIECYYPETEADRLAHSRPPTGHSNGVPRYTEPFRKSAQRGCSSMFLITDKRFLSATESKPDENKKHQMSGVL